MSDYLHLRCGDCELLLAADCVEAVGFLAEGGALDEEAGGEGHGRRLWRDAVLPVRNLSALLGVEERNQQQVVVREEERTFILEVGEVLDLRPVAEAEWRQFAAVTPQAARCFDAALPLSDGRCLLRLRRPLAWSED